MAIMKSNKKGQEFKALKLKLNSDSVSPHTIFFKEHSVRERTEDKPSGRTLFAVNIPPYADENGLKNAFSKAGNVESILFVAKPCATESTEQKRFIKASSDPHFKVAYIIFSKVSELHKALELKQLQPMNSENHQIKCGVSKWVDEYNNNLIHPKALKSEIEEFMKVYDAETKKAEEKEKKLEEEDGDGWVTVTKKGKVQSFARTENVENRTLAKEEKGRKRKELQNFYTFQIRESKMKNIVALRQKFEEDKKKIAHIKQNRRFKPF